MIQNLEITNIQSIRGKFRLTLNKLLKKCYNPPPSTKTKSLGLCKRKPDMQSKKLEVGLSHYILNRW